MSKSAGGAGWDPAPAGRSLERRRGADASIVAHASSSRQRAAGDRRRRSRDNPHDRADEAERYLLGAIMLGPSFAWPVVSPMIAADDLRRADHRLIFAAIAALGEKAEAFAVIDRLARAHELEAAGGREYLARLVDEVPAAVGVATYAEHVRDYAKRRRLAQLSQSIIDGANGPGAIEDVIAAARVGLDAVAEGVQRKATVELECGAALRPVAIEWLWRDWLARGKFHLLAGAPGTGKTTVGLALAATLSVAGRWPDGSSCPHRASTIIWSGEDDAADTLVPRLIAMGADVSAIHFVRGVRSGSRRRAFDPARDLDGLREAACKVEACGLLLVDPVVNVLGSADSHRNTETRVALQPLVDLAAELNAALLGITHFTKGSAARDPIDRPSGSVAFGALPRLVFATARSTEDGSRRLVRAKSNIGIDGGGFAYELEQGPLEGHPGVETSRLVWGEPLTGTPRELLAVAEVVEDPEQRSELREAEEFLRAELADGPVRSDDLQKRARSHGIAERTLKRARSSLRVVARKRGSHWYAELTQEGQDIRTGNLGPVGPLEEGRQSQSEGGQEGHVERF